MYLHYRSYVNDGKDIELRRKKKFQTLFTSQVSQTIEVVTSILWRSMFYDHSESGRELSNKNERAVLLMKVGMK